MALVPLPAPYDFHLSTARFRAYGADLATLWDGDDDGPGAGGVGGGALWRVIEGEAVRIAAAPGGAGVLVEPGGPAVERAVAQLLGAPLDVSGFAPWAAASGDALLARLADRFAGFRPPLAATPFEALVTAIAAQQVSLRSALAVRNRFVAVHGEAPGTGAPAPVPDPLPASPAVSAALRVRAFPCAERIAALEPEALVPLGFSRAKAAYVVGAARAAPSFDALAILPDAEVKARLVALRGLGEWTADWYLARHLARPHAWPAGDLVLRKACSRHYAGGHELTTAEVRALGERFAPFQNLVAQLLLLDTTLP